MELPELLKFIPVFAARNNVNGDGKVVIEPKASGMSAAQMLRTMSDLNVILDKAPRDDKTVRFKGKLAFMEAGRVYLLKYAPWTQLFMDNVKAFPNGKHDDISDCLVMAIDRADGSKIGSSVLGFRTV